MVEGRAGGGVFPTPQKQNMIKSMCERCYAEIDPLSPSLSYRGLLEVPVKLGMHETNSPQWTVMYATGW